MFDVWRGSLSFDFLVLLLIIDSLHKIGIVNQIILKVDSTFSVEYKNLVIEGINSIVCHIPFKVIASFA